MKIGYAGLVICATLLGACKDSFVPNLNDPSLEPTVGNAAQLQSQASGLLSGDREQHAFQILVLETMGRDAYRIDIADPRYLDMPLGTFQPGAFLVDFTWNVHYRTIRGARSLADGIEGGPFSAADKAATKGFAKTMEALQYMWLIDSRGDRGVPIQTGAAGLEPIRCEPVVLDHIRDLLDEANTALLAGGTAFPFVLPSGFTAFGTFNTPATFRQFNRALAAKNHRYRAFVNYAGVAGTGAIDASALADAITAFGESFEVLDAAKLKNGVYHVYSTQSGDLDNRNFDLSVYRVNPKVLAEADAGDARVAAKTLQDPTQRKSNAANTVSSDILFTNITGPTTPLPIIRNDELILLHAEVLWGQGQYQAALDRSNFVRQNDGGLLPKTAADFGGFVGAANQLNLLREILKQKRYSLLFESDARLVDHRIYGLFGDLGPEGIKPEPTPQDIPFPQSEIDARVNQLTCS
jgi:starch-binding outer membrane protein, SusD/RagB family